MTVLYTFDIVGQTTAPVTINALTDVTIDSEGFFNFVSEIDSRTYRIPIEGAFAHLIANIYNGTDGLTDGSAGVQGHRVFGVPALAE